MSDLILEREIRGLAGDLNMTKMAINSVQEEMRRQLMGEMGEDMTATLKGERIIKAGIVERGKHKIRCWLKKIFRSF